MIASIQFRCLGNSDGVRRARTRSDVSFHHSYFRWWSGGDGDEPMSRCSNVKMMHHDHQLMCDVQGPDGRVVVCVEGMTANSFDDQRKTNDQPLTMGQSLDLKTVH